MVSIIAGDDNFQTYASRVSSSDKLKQIHITRLEHLSIDDFSFNIFRDNPIIEAGQRLHQELQNIEWTKCSNCEDVFIGQKGRSRIGAAIAKNTTKKDTGNSSTHKIDQNPA